MTVMGREAELVKAKLRINELEDLISKGEFISSQRSPTLPQLPAPSFQTEAFASPSDHPSSQPPIVPSFSPPETVSSSVAFISAAVAVAPPPPPQTASSVVENVKFATYDKMKKMNLPEGAIRQKMSSDGLSSADVDAFFSGVASSSSSSSPIASIVVEDEKFAKYTKMRKMLPEGAVRQKMSADGLSPADIESFFASSVASGGGEGVVAASPPAAANEKYAKYQKMRNMLPDGI